MSDLNYNGEETLKIDFSKIIVPETQYNSVELKQDIGIADSISNGKVEFGSISAAYKKDGEYTFNSSKPQIINDASSNITYLNTNPEFSMSLEANKSIKGAGNVFATTQAETKPSSAELQRIVQKLDKLEKMINPNSKKSLILWEEDNSFKNIISSIVSYANSCDTSSEFPIELYDRLVALGEDVNSQIAEGTEKVTKLKEQQRINTALSEVLSNAYVSATAGLSREEYEANMIDPEICEYKEQLAVIATTSPDSEEYAKAEKAIKSKITNLENSVHITIDLERTTSKAGALQYIKQEVTPAIDRLKAAYEAQYSSASATEINGEEAIMALTVKKSLSERIYDTFVRPFANLFKRKNRAK